MATSRTASAKNKKVGMRDGAFGGFTIIEVVLVLAIAGLIFLIVFIALPQLQRAQRDTQRRNDFGRLSSAITQYQTNNNGRIPHQASEKVSSDDFVKRYLEGVNGTADNYTDPDGEKYTIKWCTMGTSGGSNFDTCTGDGGAAYNEDTVTHNIYVYNYATCDGEKIVKANNVRDYAVQYRLEGSGTYCQGSGGSPASAPAGS